MIDVIIAYHLGFKDPSFHDLRVSISQKEVKEFHESLWNLKNLRPKQDVPLCSMNGQMKSPNTSSISLVSCPEGVKFLKDVKILFELLYNVVIKMEVVVENVVRAITNDAANYVFTGKTLKDKHCTIFWTPCLHII